MWKWKWIGESGKHGADRVGKMKMKRKINEA